MSEKKIKRTNKTGSFPDNWKQKTNSEILRKPKGESLFDNAAYDSKVNSDSKVNLIDTFIAQEEVAAIYKERMAALRKFVQALLEVSPLLGLVSREIESNAGVDFKMRVSGLFQRQLSIVNLIKGDLSLDDDNENDKFVISVLAKTVSDLIGAGDLSEEKDSDLILSLLDRLDDFISSRPYLGDVIDSNMLSHDVLVNVKLALFPSTLRFSKFLSKIEFEPKAIDDWLQWHHDSTVCLAKDLAFNWDKNASFKDRERLFESSLSQCAVIVEDVWREEFNNSLSPALASTSFDSFDQQMGEFDKSLSEMSAGYLDDDSYGPIFIKKLIYQFFVDSTVRFDDLHNYKIDADLVKRYVGYYYACKSSDVWKIACENAIEKINQLTEDEYSLWMNGEGQKPMRFEYYIEAMNNTFLNLLFKPAENFSKSELLSKCKSKLAMLWGLSDAVCRIKRRDEQ